MLRAPPPVDCSDFLPESFPPQLKFIGGRNLRQCYERLAERAIGQEDLVRVMGIAERILERPIELIDG